MKMGLVLLLPVVLAGCSLNPAASKASQDEIGSYKQISQEEARRMMDKDDGHVVVDVRRQDEYDSGHIPGAILIPNESIGCDAPEALHDYDQIILLYCRIGNRSKQAAQKLSSMGFTNVYEFGGILDWTGEVVTAEEENAAKDVVLTFSSFDGGNHEYTVEIEDPAVLMYSARRDYGKRNEPEDGSPYLEIITFTGLKPGTTAVRMYGRSPIAENDDYFYTAKVDESLSVTLVPEREISAFFLSRSGDIAYDSYRISLHEDGYRISVNDGDEQVFAPDPVSALMRIIDEYGLAEWDGFGASQDGVLDGEGFLLEISLTDGSSIRAWGDNAFPENYFPAMGMIQEVLDSAVVSSDHTADETVDGAAE